MSRITDPEKIKKIVSDLLMGKMILQVGLRSVYDWGDRVDLEDVVMLEIEGGIFLHISGNHQIDRSDVEFSVRDNSSLLLDPYDGPIVWVTS